MSVPCDDGPQPSGARAVYQSRYVRLLDQSPKMRAIREIVEVIADTNATVFLRGESGVGKELVARAIHAASSRSEGPWIKVNCAALPAELLESELFGHEKGAFTGATRRRVGMFEFANYGTIFLDEIGDLPLLLQPKLLHVLQDLEFSRLGGHERIAVTARVIAATNQNLELSLDRGHFREDLYYRLNVVEIHVPPLRERREEIPFLARHFLSAFNAEYHRAVDLPADLQDLMLEYSWPGNVRELENLVRRLVVLADPASLAAELRRRLQVIGEPANESPPVSPPAPTGGIGLKEISRRAMMAAECEVLREVLDRVHWNRREAARILRVSYKTLLNKMAACGLKAEAQTKGVRK